MSLTDLKYVNALGGIQATREDGVGVYLKPGSDMHTLAEAGEWGAVAEYVAPEEPSALEIERQGMVCSAFQGRAALSDAELLTAAQTAVDAAGGITALAWEYAIEWKRTSPMIAALSAVLELTDEQVDDLFRAAMEIEA